MSVAELEENMQGGCQLGSVPVRVAFTGHKWCQ